MTDTDDREEEDAVNNVKENGEDAVNGVKEEDTVSNGITEDGGADEEIHAKGILDHQDSANGLQEDTVKEEDELQKDKPPPSESDMGIEISPYKIGRKEWEELYITVLYTIKHKLGANSSGYSVYAEDLYEYAQEAFCMSDQDHQRFLSIAQDEKPPILVLNVTVVEAQGLEAKDPNGFSDPYCMLGIQPANTLERRNSSDEEFNPQSSVRSSPGRRQGLKKLGASLKRKDRIRSNSISDTLPAKFIRTTSVKPQTLNPRWNEKFRLDIEDIRTDRLHLDIWDHDDESSVFDAARKLNEVSSLKGLGRYFKQIAQSARTSTGENIDDFLGCVNMRMEDVPSAGLDRWFCLEGRTERSSVQGQIRLKMSLGTREEAAEAEEDEDNWKEVVEHMELLWVFVQHELKQIYGPPYEWAGDLPQPALTILHQHAIQGDITELQQTLCRWTMYAKTLMEVPLDYALLYQLLDDMGRTWGDQENPLSRDEEAALAESFNLFLDYCLKLLQKHRDLFPPGNEQAQHKLTYLLKCLSALHGLKSFKWCCPFRHDLHVEITNSIKKGTLDWFNAQVANAEAQQKTHCKWTVRTLVDLINTMNNDVYKGHVYYNEEFESLTGVAYSVVVYKQLEKMVGDSLGCRIQESCSTMEAEQDESPDSEYMVTATAMFELYMALQEFIKFKDNIPTDERKNLSLINYHLWFKDAVQHWFVVAKSKAQIRLRKAVELDKVTFLDNYVKHSTSAVDAATCFVQIKEFWRQLSWPDPAGSFTFVVKVIEIICDGSVYYAKLSQQKLQKIMDADPQAESTEQQCITVNNMEYVLQTLRPLEEELGVEQIIKALNLNQGGCTANQCRESIYDMLNKAEDDVTGTIFSIICGMVEKLRPDMKKFVFHLAWAPEKLDAENAIRPLLENLDATLHNLYSHMMQANFDRLLDMMWTVLMHEVMETAQSNIGKERLSFFDRLYSSLTILVDFFHGSGKGLPLECIQNAPYQDLFHMLKLQKSETLHLIELYMLQRLEEQQKLDKPCFGILTIKTSYTPATESLYIEILNARELIPLDPTGFSDPFVIIEVVPRHFFPNCVKQRTKVQKKTLYPLFDEAFEFHISQEQLQREGAGLCFSVMDHDMMTKNDFEGEAFLPLCNVPRAPEEDARLMEIGLMHPNEKDEIIVALVARTWDKDAQDFVKNLKHRRKSALKEGEEAEDAKEDAYK